MSAQRDASWAQDPTAVEGDAELRAPVASIFRTSLRLLFVGGLGVALIGAFARDIKALVGACCVAAVAPALLWALRRGHARLAMTGAVSCVWLLACAEIALGDGIRDTGMGLFTLVILVGTLLLDRASAIFFSVLTVLSVLAIGIAGLEGQLFGPLAHAVVPGDLAILVFLLSMFAVLMHAVGRAMHKGVNDAAHNAQAYREIFNATSDAIFIYDLQSERILDVNRAACARSGFARADLIHKHVTEIHAHGLTPEAKRLLQERLRRAHSQPTQVFEWQVTPKHGQVEWLEVALHSAQIRGVECVVATLRDISDRKLVAEQVRTAERLHALGQLAGGVAHDFNNQLTGIVASATLLKEKLRVDPLAQTSLDLILQCGHRSADLTRQLLAFARKGERRQEVVEMVGLVREVALLLERSIDKRVTISIDVVGQGSTCVIGDASFLGSALLNVGLNARDAMPQGGALGFEVAHLSAEELPDRARSALHGSANGYVHVRVTDTGVGIAADALGHIFEPFFTTKPQGNGLGLSAAYGTVQAHGGVILVNSVLGTGSAFELYIPATERRETKPDALAAAPRLRPLRVLLAEDEHAAGRSTELILEDFGCAVTWQRDGQSALAAFERAPDAFDVVILDQSMPRMLGSEVGERIASLRPDVPIIATSGFAEEIGCPRARPRHIFLPKPFGAQQLAAALDKAVAGESTVVRAPVL